jgi:uncharacterized membrane protein (UPF0127 family)
LRLTKTDGTVVAQPLEQATNFYTQGMGLMFRRSIPAGGGLLIYRCSGIHMMFMRFPIDAVFLDKSNTVVKVYHRLLPWIGLIPFVWKADRVAELPAGTARRLRLERGDRLALSA